MAVSVVVSTNVRAAGRETGRDAGAGLRAARHARVHRRISATPEPSDRSRAACATASRARASVASSAWRSHASLPRRGSRRREASASGSGRSSRTSRPPSPRYRAVKSPPGPSRSTVAPAEAVDRSRISAPSLATSRRPSARPSIRVDTRPAIRMNVRFHARHPSAGRARFSKTRGLRSAPPRNPPMTHDARSDPAVEPRSVGKPRSKRVTPNWSGAFHAVPRHVGSPPIRTGSIGRVRVRAAQTNRDFVRVKVADQKPDIKSKEKKLARFFSG